MYSDFETRVKRLWLQNTNEKIETIRKNLQERDEVDLNGGNFVKPLNAIEINITNYTIDEVYNLMMQEINKRK